MVTYIQAAKLLERLQARRVTMRLMLTPAAESVEQIVQEFFHGLLLGFR